LDGGTLLWADDRCAEWGDPGDDARVRGVRHGTGVRYLSLRDRDGGACVLCRCDVACRLSRHRSRRLADSLEGLEFPGAAFGFDARVLFLSRAFQSGEGPFLRHVPCARAGWRVHAVELELPSDSPIRLAVGLIGLRGGGG